MAVMEINCFDARDIMQRNHVELKSYISPDGKLLQKVGRNGLYEVIGLISWSNELKDMFQVKEKGIIVDFLIDIQKTEKYT